MKRLLPLLALSAFATPLEARTLPPRDECASDAEFARFRAQFVDVVVRHDTQGLLALVADDIRHSLGGAVGDPGKAAFVAAWRLGDADQSSLWDALVRVLAAGCARDGERMAAPYLYFRFPAEMGPWEAGVAGPDARLYASQIHRAPVAIAWEVLEEARLDSDSGWANVRLSDGRRGFVRREDLWSPIDYHAIFERRGGEWRLTAFIAGE
jgi:hypothetical protein